MRKGIDQTLDVVVVFMVAASISFGLAAIGEPQSVWLWCDIIGFCPGGGQ